MMPTNHKTSVEAIPLTFESFAEKALQKTTLLWFLVIVIGQWIFINGGAPGHTDAFDGPFDIFLSFAHTLLPLALLEVYLFVQDRADSLGRLAMAIGLFVLTVLIGLGIFMAGMVFWLPHV